MISKQEYLNAKQIVDKYEDEQLRLSRVNGSSKCPFCSGTKTKPFIRAFSNQNCTNCDKNGMISNKSLVIMGLEDCIEKPKK
jgi:DnaJ-class molecular chaperone